MTPGATVPGRVRAAPRRRAHGRLPSGGWLLRRLAIVPPLLFGLATVTFFVTRIIPGDPSYSIAGPSATPEQIQQAREQLGFDQSLWAQYVDFLRSALRLDFGTSLFTGNPVAQDLADRLPSTLFLIVAALTIAALLGVV